MMRYVAALQETVERWQDEVATDSISARASTLVGLSANLYGQAPYASEALYPTSAAPSTVETRGRSYGGGQSSFNPFAHEGQGKYTNPYEQAPPPTSQTLQINQGSGFHSMGSGQHRRRQEPTDSNFDVLSTSYAQPQPMYSGYAEPEPVYSGYAQPGSHYCSAEHHQLSYAPQQYPSPTCYPRDSTYPPRRRHLHTRYPTQLPLHARGRPTIARPRAALLCVDSSAAQC
ncbi:hypothetical protein ACHHYP_12039 [Achlya hypogyna]|uniref:Uncharacterized protein n=1 Tax=Achlya hypogyna TaxID=1202772 RepID=A0A1V9YHU3_ACHHY|nr:hypothetical protein ACHHYP_12039 [Achlya hypogyna]